MFYILYYAATSATTGMFSSAIMSKEVAGPSFIACPPSSGSGSTPAFPGTPVLTNLLAVIQSFLASLANTNSPSPGGTDRAN